MFNLGMTGQDIVGSRMGTKAVEVVATDAEDILWADKTEGNKPPGDNGKDSDDEGRV